MRLTAKFTAVLFLALAVVLGVHAYFKGRHEIALFETDMRRDHDALGTALALAIEKTRHLRSESEVVELIDGINPEKPRVAIRWVWFDTASGDPQRPTVDTLDSGRVNAAKPLHVTIEDPDGTRLLCTYVSVRFGGSSRPGGIEIIESLAAERQYIRSAVTRIAVTTAIVLVLFGVLAATLGAFFVARPVKRLVEKARRVGEGDLKYSLRLTQKDEFAEIADEMNRMSDRLAEATERAESETSKRISAMDQLRHADRLAIVGKLAAGIAHELGTPLNVVMARAKMVASGEVTGTEAADNATTIFEQSKRMAEIIRQLLDFARPRSPQRREIRLSHVVRQTIALLGPIAEKGGVQIALDVEPTDPTAEIDPEQLQQVLSNVMVNGIQAMPRGGLLTIKIERSDGAARHAAGDELVQISITDEGVGIPVEDQQHLFEPFFSTKEVGEGTGLGLSVSCGIVREHDGWMDVESSVGRGTSVRITLPRRAPS